MLEKLREIICDYANIAPEEITEETNIRRDLALDSLSLVNLAVAIEEEFELEIPDRAVVGIETVADVIAIIEEYKDED
ncbi:MAG: acyl carrier protein [Clostridia bacterium]|nr:acyl carrier protein [Clostridia bacterium]